MVQKSKKKQKSSQKAKHTKRTTVFARNSRKKIVKKSEDKE